MDTRHPLAWKSITSGGKIIRVPIYAPETSTPTVANPSAPAPPSSRGLSTSDHIATLSHYHPLHFTYKQHPYTIRIFPDRTTPQGNRRLKIPLQLIDETSGKVVDTGQLFDPKSGFTLSPASTALSASQALNRLEQWFAGHGDNPTTTEQVPFPLDVPALRSDNPTQQVARENAVATFQASLQELDPRLPRHDKLGTKTKGQQWIKIQGRRVPVVADKFQARIMEGKGLSYVTPDYLLRRSHEGFTALDATDSLATKEAFAALRDGGSVYLTNQRRVYRLTLWTDHSTGRPTFSANDEATHHDAIRSEGNDEPRSGLTQPYSLNRGREVGSNADNKAIEAALEELKGKLLNSSA